VADAAAIERDLQTRAGPGNVVVAGNPA